MLDDRFLYKYRSIDRSDSARAHHIITRREAFFAKKNSFNDPFDCRHGITFDGNRNQQARYLKRIARLGNPDKNRLERRIRVSEFRRENVLINPNNIAICQQKEEEIHDTVGIFCLSRSPDDILMWSHYSDGHTGYCVVFQDDPSDPFIGRAQEVIYTDEFPIVNPVREDSDTRFRKSILTKAERWSYEKEWRIIDARNGPGVQVYPVHLLHGVILGAKMSVDDKLLVRDWCRSGSHSIEFYQAHLHESRYALRIERLTDFK